MKTRLSHILLAISLVFGMMMLWGNSASAQTMTTFAKNIISFDSVPQGAEVIYNGQVIGRTPFKAEVKAGYLLSCDKEDADQMPENDIKAYNTIKMENYIKENSESPKGEFPFFGMSFTFRDKNGVEGSTSIPLQWEEILFLGMKGSKIFYPQNVFFEF